MVIDTLDWSHKAATILPRNVLDNVRSGDIILMHSDEDKGETAAALPIIIEGLQKRLPDCDPGPDVGG
jgi:peptidoglycan/xylan/chitin deacetylase (PgdA/CDA1 family)